MKYSFIISKNSRSLEKQTDNSEMEGEYEVDHFFEEIVSTLQIPFFLRIEGWYFPTGHQNQKHKREAYIHNGNLATYDSNV